MSFISVFDVLGPNMIGPSSSHTAGAAIIGYLAQKMIKMTTPFLHFSRAFAPMMSGSEIPFRSQRTTASSFHLFPMKRRQKYIPIQWM